MKLVIRNYWWPEVTRDVGKYVNRCNMYPKIKNRTKALAGKLSKVLEKLWIHLTVDFITNLPLVAEKYVILVICNRLFKIMYFVAIIEETLAEGLMWLFRDNMWKLHGLLESCQDR